MTIKNHFKDFEAGSVQGTAAFSDARAGPSHSESPDAGYDAGYASGWDDAVRASQERGERISAELERTIQDLGFSYHEALDQLRGQFLDAISRFLDALLPQTIPQVLVSQLETTLAQQTDQDPGIEFVVSADQLELFQALVPEALAASVALVAEDTLGPDQAFIRIGPRECLIDVEPLVADFREQISALRHKNQEVRDAG